MGQGKAELWQHGGSMTKKEGSGCFPNPLIFLVGRMGIEPTTNGLKVAFPGKAIIGKFHLRVRRRAMSVPHRAKLMGRRVCLGLFQVKRVELRFNRFLGIAELLLDDAVELVHGAFSLLEVVVREGRPMLSSALSLI
jgi:hypothetical protein